MADISIETTLSGANHYSTLTVVECKSLGRKVGVDDIREFSAKISEIGEHNTKGLFVANNLFQQGAYDFAVAKQMGLLRLTGNDTYKWINYRRKRFTTDLHQYSLSSQFTDEGASHIPFIADIGGRALTNFADVLLEAGIIDSYNHKVEFIEVPYLKNEEINDTIREFVPAEFYGERGLMLEKLCEHLQKLYGITFKVDGKLPDGIFGKIEFDPLTISVSNDLIIGSDQWRFTLAHEIGHFCLHHELLNPGMRENLETQLTISLARSITNESHKRLERQANIFAGNLLMPWVDVYPIVAQYFLDERIHKTYLYMDTQPCNLELVYRLLHKLSARFGVSTEVAKVRLMQCGLIHKAFERSLQGAMRQVQSDLRWGNLA